MKRHPTASKTQKIFTAHGAGYVMVSGERHERPVVVTPELVLTDWNPADFASMNESHFSYFLALKPELVLLGTGATQQFAHPGLYRALIRAGIGVECMDTPAACRTYNILLADERQVAAAIFP